MNDNFEDVNSIKNQIIKRNLGLSFVIFGLIISRYLVDYLFFHALSEFFSIIITFTVFIITWNLKYKIQNNVLLIFGISCLYISFLDLIHTLGFYGMGIFTEYGRDLATQLWIVSRYMQSISIFVAFLLIHKRNNPINVFLIYLFITTIIIFLIFARLFPVCYDEVTGLTPFKKISEYIICGILLSSIFIIIKKKYLINVYVLQMFIHSILFMIFSEISFTFYIDVYGIFNLTGHILKFIAVYFIYLSILKTELTDPFQSLFRDISVKQKELEGFSNAIPEAFIVIDSNGKILFVNDLFQNILIDSNHMPLKIGDNLKKIQINNILLNKIKEIIDIKQEVNTIIESKKESEWYEAITRIIRYSDKPSDYSVLVLLRDITRFLEYDAIQKKFISITSHEMRTPLTNLSLSMNNLEKHFDTLTDESKKQLISILSRNIESLQELTENLLDVSKLDSEKMKLNYESFKISEAINHVIEELKPISSAKSIRFTIECPKESKILADPQRIIQVIQIIIHNAIKYSPKNSVVKIMIEENHSGRYSIKSKTGTLIKIQDYGIGIKNQDKYRIFEKFFRSDDVKNIPGTGLGLYIAKEIVELHQGDIFIESEFGKGSIFIIFLPIN